MEKKMNKNRMIFYGITAIAVIAIIGIAFMAFANQPNKMPPTMVEGTLKINWNMGEAPTSTNADAPISTEITAYQASTSGYNPSPYRYLYYDASTGYGLVKEVREVNLPQGLVSLALKSESAHIDPTSISVKDVSYGNTQLLEQNYDYDLASTGKLNSKYIGEQVTVKTGNETIIGTLLSADSGLLLQTTSGVVSLNGYDQIIYPTLPQGLLTTPTLNLLLDIQSAGKHTLQLSYLTSGINWEANYVAIANAGNTRLDLQAIVSVTNDAGTTFKNANLKLVAGNVNRQETQSNYDYGYAEATMSKAVGAAPGAAPQFKQQNLGEYHLYSLDRTVTLASGEQKQITFFEANNVKTEKELVFAPDSNSNVQFKLNFENANTSGLGMPMPAGKVRVFQPDSTGQLQFIGEDSISHTPEAEKVRLYLGDAFDVTGTRTQTSQNSWGDCADQREYTVTLKNSKDTDAAVTVIHQAYYGEVRIISESQPSTKESSTKFSWKVPVKAKSSATLTYKLYQEWC